MPIGDVALGVAILLTNRASGAFAEQAGKEAWA